MEVASLDGSESTCLLCGTTELTNGFRSDGVWLWPDDLGHYVEHHNIVLPDRFLEHIRALKYQAPSGVAVPIELLPWPPAT